jgi:hypothetical protein
MKNHTVSRGVTILIMTCIMTHANGCSLSAGGLSDAGPSADAGWADAAVAVPDRETVLRELAFAYCDYYRFCNPLVFERAFRNNIDACRTGTRDQLEQLPGIAWGALVADRTQFDSAQYHQCLEDLQSCGYDPQAQGSCARIFVGRVRIGSPCFWSFECSSDSFCAFPERPGMCGSCQKSAQEGEDCAERLCDPSMSCAYELATAERRCFLHGARENEDCTQRACEPLLECVDRVCKKRGLEEGVACGRENGLPGCSRNHFLVCEDGHCVRRIEVMVSGEPCDDVNRLCFLDEACIQSICTEFPENGSACLDWDGLGRCAAGYCDDRQTCVPLYSPGATCTASTTDRCPNGYPCLDLPEEGTCRRFVWELCN